MQGTCANGVCYVTMILNEMVMTVCLLHTTRWIPALCRTLWGKCDGKYWRVWKRLGKTS